MPNNSVSTADGLCIALERLGIPFEHVRYARIERSIITNEDQPLVMCESCGRATRDPQTYRLIFTVPLDPDDINSEIRETAIHHLCVDCIYAFPASLARRNIDNEYLQAAAEIVSSVRDYENHVRRIIRTGTRIEQIEGWFLEPELQNISEYFTIGCKTEWAVNFGETRLDRLKSLLCDIAEFWRANPIVVRTGIAQFRLNINLSTMRNVSNEVVAHLCEICGEPFARVNQTPHYNRGHVWNRIERRLVPRQCELCGWHVGFAPDINSGDLDPDIYRHAATTLNLNPETIRLVADCLRQCPCDFVTSIARYHLQHGRLSAPQIASLRGRLTGLEILAEAGQTGTPNCPEHEIPMRLIHGRHGFFWGCTRYPTCRRTINFGVNPHGQHGHNPSAQTQTIDVQAAPQTEPRRRRRRRRTTNRNGITRSPEGIACKEQGAIFKESLITLFKIKLTER